MIDILLVLMTLLGLKLNYHPFSSNWARGQRATTTQNCNLLVVSYIIVKTLNNAKSKMLFRYQYAVIDYDA